MSKLDGSIAKFRRAGKQIKTLNRTIMATLKGHSYRPVISERDRDPNYRVLRLRAEQEGLPIEWSAIIGEIAHDLRSCLDLLACQLALVANPGRPELCEIVTFPLFVFGPKSKISKHQRFRWRDTTGQYFKRNHRAYINGLQPYYRRNGYKRSPLWLLHELNNADKHRFIQVTALTLARTSGPTIRLTRDPNNVHHTPVFNGIEIKPGVTLKNGAKVGRVETDSDEGVEVDFSITAKVIFSNGCGAVKGLELMPVLVEASNAVNQILSHFARDPDLR